MTRGPPATRWLSFPRCTWFINLQHVRGGILHAWRKVWNSDISKERHKTERTLIKIQYNAQSYSLYICAFSRNRYSLQVLPRQQVNPHFLVCLKISCLNMALKHGLLCDVFHVMDNFIWNDVKARRCLPSFSMLYSRID